MQFLICEKHGKWEKAGSKVGVNGYICMNRYCPQSFRVFCSGCKNDHRDHSIKVLTIEDVSFLVERLLKAPFREVGRVVGETLDIMKKLKLIKEFRKKIDILEKEVQREALKLIDQTESLVQEYSLSQQSVTRLAELFAAIEEPATYRTFREGSSDLLGNLDYNFKKDKFELGSAAIKEKEDRRRKSVERAKRKIEEVRDYSMKIIEVILHNDSDEEEQDHAYQKKHYEVLKTELCLDKNEQELEEEINELKNSMTTNRSRMRKEAAQYQVQTTQQLILLTESEDSLKAKTDEIKQAFQQSENELKKKLDVLELEKQSLKLQLNAVEKQEQTLRGKLQAAENEKEKLKVEVAQQKQKCTEIGRRVAQVERKLRRNKSNRLQKELTRQEIIGRIIEFSQAKSANTDQKE